MLLSLACALALAGVHMGAGALRPGGRVPPEAWHSAAGGASVAFVFLDLLPHLADGDETIGAAMSWLAAPLWLLGLLGLAVFYVLEHHAQASADAPEGGAATSRPTFWTHLVAFAVYNALVGYVLVERGTENLTETLLYTLSLGLHLFVMDDAMREHHRARYSHLGRWVLAGALLVGWGVGTATAFPPGVQAALTAFLSGALVLNVMKEELPSEREGRVVPFLVGLTAHSALLLTLKSL